jgi:NADH dehydrogenase
MSRPPIHVVTGAFGYTGRYIASRLLSKGIRVRTLTGSPSRKNPFGAAIDVRPFSFSHAERLRENLEGAEVLYNTYWVRFNHKEFRHDAAVRNTKILFTAAKESPSTHLRGGPGGCSDSGSA